MSSNDLFRAERLPVLQNRTFETAAEAVASPTGDVVLAQHEVSGLVYNREFDPSRLVYDSSYQNEQACSPIFRRHLAAIAEIVERHLGRRSLVEIGCGKGYFLALLKQNGFTVTGIDPAYEGSDPDIIKARFGPGLGVSADGIILRHVLEHIPDPYSFLMQVAAANGGRGTMYIEVPCFDWILGHGAWFDIFYEHVNYFRLGDFSRMFGRVYESGRVFGGQYLFVVADLATLRMPAAGAADRVVVPPGFMSGLKRAIAQARERSGGRLAVWGAASKGVIFSLYMQRANVRIDAVIDINPAKQGRFLGTSGLQVSSPEEGLSRLRPGDVIFVMNGNYLKEIMASTGNSYRYLTVD